MAAGSDAYQRLFREVVRSGEGALGFSGYSSRDCVKLQLRSAERVRVCSFTVIVSVGIARLRCRASRRGLAGLTARV